MRPSLEQVTSKPCPLPSFGDGGFGDAELFALALYYGMLEAGRFGKD
jgi:hypothetical protein